MALVVILGVGMNLVPILATRKARIGTLFLSDLAHIMAFLSDDGAGRCLEWIQIQSKCGDVAVEPRYPKSKEDVSALTAIRLHHSNLTGERECSYFPVVPNGAIGMFSVVFLS